jgi:hypothetical protein
MHEPDGRQHVEGNDQCGRPREQPHDEQHRRKDLSDIDQVGQGSRQAMGCQHAADPVDAFADLRNAVQQDEDAECDAQNELAGVVGFGHEQIPGEVVGGPYVSECGRREKPVAGGARSICIQLFVPWQGCAQPRTLPFARC